MTREITIQIPFSELSWGICYAKVELKDGETAEQYLAKVKDGTVNILKDAVDEEWDTYDSESYSFDHDEAEINNDP